MGWRWVIGFGVVEESVFTINGFSAEKVSWLTDAVALDKLSISDALQQGSAGRQRFWLDLLTKLTAINSKTEFQKVVDGKFEAARKYLDGLLAGKPSENANSVQGIPDEEDGEPLEQEEVEVDEAVSAIVRPLVTSILQFQDLDADVVADVVDGHSSSAPLASSVSFGHLQEQAADFKIDLTVFGLAAVQKIIELAMIKECIPDSRASLHCRVFESSCFVEDRFRYWLTILQVTG